jgi:hypothetical protein
MTKAIIYIPTGQLDPAAVLRCLTHCQTHGYEDGGLERDWHEALEQLATGEVGIIVVDRVEHLDPNRVPRIEVVADMPAARGHCRTRVIRRRGGAT